MKSLKVLFNKVFVLSLLLCVAMSAYSQDATLTVQAPNAVVKGERFRVSFTVNTNKAKDFRAPVFEGLTELSGPSTSTSSSMQIINGQRTSSASITYTYVLIGGLVGSGGGELPVISNGVSVGNILASHDRELEYDEYKGSWIADMSTTTQYRGVLCGNVSKKQLIRNCKVGGAVGSVTGGSGEDRYRPQTLHTLNDTEGDPYYWQRWVQGYTTVSVYESLDFAK